MTCSNYLHHVITSKHFAASLDLNLPFYIAEERAIKEHQYLVTPCTFLLYKTDYIAIQ